MTSLTPRVQKKETALTAQAVQAFSVPEVLEFELRTSTSNPGPLTETGKMVSSCSADLSSPMSK